ncbi:hypothetical protein [Azoarcus taiwanensis]|uniref:Uncharacterized protein n=1 Tax=Azoarcus taiwanensis TaxID=666964 RepID=A0A972JBA9_9RHOO|nr:hypothetical protein [Azoarcus taiwanensis]NMG04855.1 hypothetical protein [Azoarcus taiwanensis]
MYIVTNREVDESASDVGRAFGSRPNRLGPNELRFAEAWRERGKWQVRILPDQVTGEMAKEVGLVAPADPETGETLPLYASSYVARKLQRRINPRVSRASEFSPVW